jgi:hypothetical protein
MDPRCTRGGLADLGQIGDLEVVAAGGVGVDRQGGVDQHQHPVTVLA